MSENEALKSTANLQRKELESKELIINSKSE